MAVKRMSIADEWVFICDPATRNEQFKKYVRQNGIQRECFAALLYTENIEKARLFFGELCDLLSEPEENMLMNSGKPGLIRMYFKRFELRDKSVARLIEDPNPKLRRQYQARWGGFSLAAITMANI